MTARIYVFRITIGFAGSTVKQGVSELVDSVSGIMHTVFEHRLVILRLDLGRRA